MLKLAPGERGVEKRLPIGDVGALTSFFEFRSLKKHCLIPNKLRLWQKYNVSLKRNNFFCVTTLKVLFPLRSSLFCVEIILIYLYTIHSVFFLSMVTVWGGVLIRRRELIWRCAENREFTGIDDTVLISTF